MKTCSGCKHSLPRSEFNKNRAKSDGLQTKCRECSKTHSKVYYQKHSLKMRKQIRESNKKRKQETKRKVYEYLLKHPCVVCGEEDPVVLDFDHRPRVRKFAAVSVMLRDRYSWKRIKAEIAKCDVRCANCHRRKTAKDQGWFAEKAKAKS